MYWPRLTATAIFKQENTAFLHRKMIIILLAGFARHTASTNPSSGEQICGITAGQEIKIAFTRRPETPPSSNPTVLIMGSAIFGNRLDPTDPLRLGLLKLTMLLRIFQDVVLCEIAAFSCAFLADHTSKSKTKMQQGWVQARIAQPTNTSSCSTAPAIFWRLSRL